MTEDKPTTGIREIDQILGGVVQGDNVVWESDSGAPIDRFVSAFLLACEKESSPLVYVSFNRSPQTITACYGDLFSRGLFTLVDCFSSGKGNGDKMFLEFFKASEEGGTSKPIHLKEPSDPVKLQDALIELGSRSKTTAKYVFDSLTGMLDLWGDEKRVLRFFGHFCPRLYDLNTIAFWLLEKGAHSESFLAKVRHITQVVLEVSVSQGTRVLTVRKAANRRCSDIGIPRRFDVNNGQLTMATESREGRELALLRSMSEALGSALDPSSFFERTMQTLATELGMVRGTLVFLDKASNKLKIAAAHGLSSTERERGEYAIGEGVTGHVVKTGIPEVIPDISVDPRFLDRTVARRGDLSYPIAFICVPLYVDDEVAGALSVDRPFAVEATLEKDLRLLSIVAATVSQVLKINRMVRMEKEEIIVRDQGRLRELRRRFRLDNVIGESEAIRRVLAMAGMVADSRASILITGDTGTGKEMIAHVVHFNSSRANGPFVKVNCGALPETLLESELFGHVKGSFTGAVRDHKGRFELANGGTILLDEIGEMSPRLQVKLLRVLQEQEFEPVGSMRTVSVNVRVVAATAKDLKEEIAQGRFRQDLYYRLNVVPIHLPPLRDRRADIPLLVDHFLEKYNRENKKKITKMSRKVLDVLLEYPWPGNVRELENCIERSVVMSQGDTLVEDLLPTEVREYKHGSIGHAKKRTTGILAEIKTLTETMCQGATDLEQARSTILETVEETAIRMALQRGLSQRELAHKLGMSRMTLRNRIKRYGLE